VERKKTRVEIGSYCLVANYQFPPLFFSETNAMWVNAVHSPERQLHKYIREAK